MTEPNLISPAMPTKDTRPFYRRPWFITLGIIAVLWFGLPPIVRLLTPASVPGDFTLAGEEQAGGPAFADVQTDSDPSQGQVTAPVVIVEFGDFQCPFCKQAAPIMKDLLRNYPEAVRLQYRDFPLTDVHPQALAAAEAAQCAHLQGKFWQYHDALFASVGEDEIPEALFLSIAQSIGLDTEAFGRCRENHQTLLGIRQDFEAGVAAGVRGTPTWFVNGRMVEGALALDTWQKVVLAALQQALKK